MIGLMDQIRGLRDNNKHLNDEQRRKNAEEMILKLSKYMDIGSDEDEDIE